MLAEHELVYETYGELNAAGDNAVLICHALSGTHHAAGFYADDGERAGWWDLAIGPGKPIDTRRLFVVCSNNIGGCDGSTGPNTLNPETGKPWGAKFPQPQVQDWVRSQKLLAEYLGISRWAAVIGGSLGGMQALQWAIDYPEWVEHCVALAAAPKLTAQNIAFNEIARHAILSDPDWCDGDYLSRDTIPSRGVALARMVGPPHLYVRRWYERPLWPRAQGREFYAGSRERVGVPSRELSATSGHADFQLSLMRIPMC